MQAGGDAKRGWKGHGLQPGTEVRSIAVCIRYHSNHWRGNIYLRGLIFLSFPSLYSFSLPPPATHCLLSFVLLHWTGEFSALSLPLSWPVARRVLFLAAVTCEISIYRELVVVTGILRMQSTIDPKHHSPQVGGKSA